MRRLFVLLAIMVMVVGTVSADAFSAWSAYGDAWKATNDTYTLMMWNGTGSHTWLSDGNATEVEYLVVAGGGGGANNAGGGGGAGGLLNGTGFATTGSITVVVGAGGAGATVNALRGGNGTDSSFGSLVATGGGGGGSQNAGANSTGYPGGSGGGGGVSTGGAGTSGQGLAGGTGYTDSATYSIAGGGGGNGTAGQNAQVSTKGGDGGAGGVSLIIGVSAYYAAGGGGGTYKSGGIPGGTGGSSIGGNGGTSSTPGGNGVVNTGSGGGGGGYGAVGGNGASGVVIISYESPGISGISASFTGSSNPSTVNTAVSFTDTSTGTPTTWNWSIDGDVTNTTQNAAYIFSTLGAHTVDLNVTNSTGYFSNITKTQTVVNASGFVYKDLWQDPHFTLTVKVTDTSNVPILVSTVTDSNSATYTTTNGTAFFTEDYGTVVLYVAADGYDGRAVSYVVDEDRTVTVKLAKATPAGTPSTWYSPWQVRVRIVDYYGKPLPNVNVTANYVASTLPSGNTSWLVSAYGINAAVADDMVNSGVAMAGNTDDNGGLSFTMFKSLQYRLTITNTTLSVASTKTLYPSDQEYVIYVRTAGQTVANNTLAMRNGTLPWYSVNSTHINLNMTYVDTSLCTSQLVFRVWFRDNGTEVHNTTWSGFGASYVYDNHTVPKAPIGTEYLWGYNATTVC